ncbi:hypothetical protein QQG55_55080 [Brugia pahangi]
MSIPRLELLSVLIGNYTKLLPRFIQNRIEEIRKSNFELKYIPSDQNPIDIATKGLSQIKLQNCKQWWKRLRWLELKKSEWPKYFVIQETMNLQKILL